MVDFVNNVRSFVNYAIFCELCDRMRFEVDCVKSHHRVISEGLVIVLKLLLFIIINYYYYCCWNYYYLLLIIIIIIIIIIILYI